MKKNNMYKSYEVTFWGHVSFSPYNVNDTAGNYFTYLLRARNKKEAIRKAEKRADKDEHPAFRLRKVEIV